MASATVATHVEEPLDTSVRLVTPERITFQYPLAGPFRRSLAYFLDACVIAIDETPVGTFVEIEGDEAGVAAAARTLGRAPSDYIVDSYRGLFVHRCEELGVPVTDMLFQGSQGSQGSHGSQDS